MDWRRFILAALPVLRPVIKTRRRGALTLLSQSRLTPDTFSSVVRELPTVQGQSGSSKKKKKSLNKPNRDGRIFRRVRRFGEKTLLTPPLKVQELQKRCKDLVARGKESVDRTELEAVNKEMKKMLNSAEFVAFFTKKPTQLQNEAVNAVLLELFKEDCLLLKPKVAKEVFTNSGCIFSFFFFPECESCDVLMSQKWRSAWRKWPTPSRR